MSAPLPNITYNVQPTYCTTSGNSSSDSNCNQYYEVITSPTNNSTYRLCNPLVEGTTGKCLAIYNNTIINNSDSESTTSTGQIADFHLNNGSEPNSFIIRNNLTNMCVTPNGPVSCASAGNAGDYFFNPVEITGQPETDALVSPNCISNQCITSKNGNFKFCQQPNGNFTITNNTNQQTIGSTNTNTSNALLCMNNDGSLTVVQNNNGKSGKILWSSGPARQGLSPPFRAIMQNDGNICIYDTNGTWSWSSNSGSGQSGAQSTLPPGASPMVVTPILQAATQALPDDWANTLNSATALGQDDLTNGAIFQIVTDPVKNECLSADTANYLDNYMKIKNATCNVNDLKQNFQLNAQNQIKNLYNNNCMNIYQALATDNAELVLYPCNPATQNTLFNVQADPTQPTPITTFANKCLDTSGQNLVQNTCQFGNQNQIFQYKRVNSVTIPPTSASMVSNQINNINNGLINLLNQPGNAPSVNYTQEINNYSQQELQTAQQNQQNLISTAEKTSMSLLDTYNKMYPQLQQQQQNQNQPQPSAPSTSSVASTSASVTESFTNLSNNIKSKQKAYNSSVGSLLASQQDLDLISQKSRLLMDSVKQKQFYIELLKLAILALIPIGAILISYYKGFATISTALILLVITSLYISYRLYILLYDPMYLKLQIEKISLDINIDLCKYV